VKCLGRNLDDHCCWLKGKVCEFLEENSQEGFRWTCGLRRELGDWDKVLEDERYKENVAPILEPIGINCRDWPTKHCKQCGAGLDG